MLSTQLAARCLTSRLRASRGRLPDHAPALCSLAAVHSTSIRAPLRMGHALRAFLVMSERWFAAGPMAISLFSWREALRAMYGRTSVPLVHSMATMCSSQRPSGPSKQTSNSGNVVMGFVALVDYDREGLLRCP